MRVAEVALSRPIARARASPTAWLAISRSPDNATTARHRRAPSSVQSCSPQPPIVTSAGYEDPDAFFAPLRALPDEDDGLTIEAHLKLLQWILGKDPGPHHIDAGRYGGGAPPPTPWPSALGVA